MNVRTEQLADVMASSFETYVPALRRYFSKRVAPIEIDDLIQEVLVRIHAHAGGTAIQQLDRYLFAVAANVLTDRARRRTVRHETAHESLEESHHPAEELTPERVLMDREALEVVVAAISELSARTREVFVLHRFDELSCTSIAKQLGISVSAVEKHIMKALRCLHERLSKD